jgi:PncC family amidohydrolase
LKLTVATAESLTGGLVSAALTSIPGSSDYFLAGVNAYSNRAKHLLLEIPGGTLKSHGAVSQECSALMAENVARVVGSDVGLSTTGIAGPGGGTPKKPVGLVHFAAWGRKQGILTWEARLTGPRHAITMASVGTALDLLIELLGVETG